MALIEESLNRHYSLFVRKELDELSESFTITDPNILSHCVREPRVTKNVRVLERGGDGQEWQGIPGPQGPTKGKLWRSAWFSNKL
jgi:hypothetical protein